MKKKLLTLAVILSGLFACTGCFKGEREIVINNDGSVNLTVTAAVSEDFMVIDESDGERYFDNVVHLREVLSDCENLNYSTRSYEKNGKKWVEDKQMYNSITLDDAEDLLTEYNGAQFKIKESDKLFTKTVTIEMSKIQKNPNSNEMDYYYQMSSVEDVFTIVVPTKIVETDGVIDAYNKQKVSWDVLDIDLGIEDEITMTVTYLKYKPIVISAIAAAVVVIDLVVLIAAALIIFVVVKRKRNNKK